MFKFAIEPCHFVPSSSVTVSPGVYKSKMSDLPFHCVADVCSELFPLDPILESDWFENALQDLYTAPEYWQDVDHADMPSFLDSTLPYSLDNTALHYSLDATSRPGPDLQVPTCDTTVSDSDHLQISLLGCFPRDHEASLPQEPSLSPLLPRNERAHASMSKNAPFEQHLHEFDAGTNTAATGRKRKRFSTQRRKEVGQLRKVGACLPCKLAKSQCQLSSPCLTCIKACGGPKLGRTLCTRQSLVNVRFTTDLWNRNSDDFWLKQRITSFVGPVRSLLILLDSPVFCHDEQLRILEHPEETCPAQPKLRIQVQWLSPISSNEGGDSRELHSSRSRASPDQQYAIPWALLPDLEEMEDWALDDFDWTYKLCGPHPSLGFFRSAFFSFARMYRTCDKNLPHKHMVDKAVRLTALHGLWRRVLVIDSEEREQVSDVVHIQLAMVITKRITDLEVDLLSALQKHILGPKGPGKDNMLPIWICLWLLILTYRDTIDAWSSPEHEKKGLPQLARHMYDMLVTLYSGLFRTSSPLSLNWLFDDIYRLFGRECKLIVRMGGIKTEFAQFHKFRGHSHTKDALMRKLIFEREMKFLKRLPQDALHTAHYESSKVYYPIRVSTSGDSDPSISGPRVSFIQSN